MRSQFEAEEKLGFVEPMTLAEALERFGDRSLLAAIGATAKKAVATDVRVIVDATHGALTNSVMRCPTEAVIKAWLTAQASEGGSYLGLVYDVSHAHR